MFHKQFRKINPYSISSVVVSKGGADPMGRMKNIYRAISGIENRVVFFHDPRDCTVTLVSTEGHRPIVNLVSHNTPPAEIQVPINTNALTDPTPVDFNEAQVQFIMAALQVRKTVMNILDLQTTLPILTAPGPSIHAVSSKIIGI